MIFQNIPPKVKTTLVKSVEVYDHPVINNITNSLNSLSDDEYKKLRNSMLDNHHTAYGNLTTVKSALFDKKGHMVNVYV